MTTAIKRHQVVKQINKAICGLERGIYNDETWAAVNRVQAALETVTQAMGVEANLLKADYGDIQEGRPTSKKWLYTVEGFKPEVVVMIKACGAGTVSDPLDRYDIVTYAS